MLSYIMPYAGDHVERVMEMDELTNYVTNLHPAHFLAPVS